MDEKTKRRVRGAAAVLLGALALALAFCALRESGLWEKVNSPEELRALIDQAGPFAGVVYFCVQLLTVVVAPIPSNVSMLAGAMALGLWPALLIGLAAIWLGSMLVFLLARRLGQKAVQRWVDRGVMEKYLPVIEEKQEMFLFLALLFPFFPDDVLCILAGVTTIPAAHFAVLVLLARPWGLAFAAVLGSGALRMPLRGWAILLPALCAAFYFAMKYSREIEERLFQAITKGSNKGKRDRS